MKNIAGIERDTRARLVEVLRGTKPVFTIKEAAGILGMSNTATAKMMARWVEQGWLIRVRRNAYMAVPPEARSPDDVSVDPLIIASRVFDPSYLGGWTAAEQWGLTEQIFRTIMVITTRKLNIRRIKIRSSEFVIKTISEYRFFGIKIVWRDNSKISFSDPTKTIVDLLNDPALAGGSRMLYQMLKTFLSSKDYASSLLLDYCARMNNGAIYKRLGYMLEKSGEADTNLLKEIRKKMTTGNAKLDPAIPCSTLVTRWRLFIPQQWDENSYD